MYVIEKYNNVVKQLKNHKINVKYCVKENVLICNNTEKKRYTHIQEEKIYPDWFPSQLLIEMKLVLQ